MKQQDPAHDIVVVERNRPYDTFGWGVVFSDQTLGNLQAGRPDQRRADPRRLQPLGRHRGQHPRPQGPLGRPRLLRHRPEAPAQHPAAALRGARREAGVRDRRAGRRPVRRRRPDHRQRRPEQPHPRQARRDLPARHRPARLPLRLARHPEAVRGVHLRVRGNRMGLVPGPRLPLRRRDLDLHRRDARAGLARRRPRDDGEGGRDRVLRAAVREVPRRPCADVERQPPARLGAVDPLSARRLPELGPPQRPCARSC